MNNYLPTIVNSFDLQERANTLFTKLRRAFFATDEVQIPFGIEERELSRFQNMGLIHSSFKEPVYLVHTQSSINQDQLQKILARLTGKYADIVPSMINITEDAQQTIAITMELSEYSTTALAEFQRELLHKLNPNHN